VGGIGEVIYDLVWDGVCAVCFALDGSLTCRDILASCEVGLVIVGLVRWRSVRVRCMHLGWIGLLTMGGWEVCLG
jgi:hypothetical protein